MGDVVKNITDRCALLWGEHPSENIDDVLDIYEQVLGFYSNEILAEAFGTVAGDHMPGKRFPWPAPAIFKRACETIIARTAKPSRLEFPPIVEREPPTPEAIARVNEMVKKAAREMSKMPTSSSGDEAEQKPKTKPLPSVTRDDFTGRWSPVFHQFWHTETLAETIRKHDAERGLTPLSKAMSGERDE